MTSDDTEQEQTKGLTPWDCPNCGRKHGRYTLACPERLKEGR